MGEVLDRAQLVDAAALGDRAIGVTIPRSQVEDVLRSDGTPELVLEMVRRENGEEPTSIHLEWDPQELEQLLGRVGDAGDLALLFDRDDIERLIDEEVEAHGLRERAAVLAVAATAATAAGVGHASAQPMVPVHDGGGGGAATIEMVSDSALSGPQSTGAPIQSVSALETMADAAAQSPQLVSDNATSGPVEFAAGPSSLVSDSALSGPQATPESPELVSDSALSGPQSTPGPAIQSASALESVADAAAQSPQLVSDAALSGPTELAAGPSSLVSDAALSGPQTTPGAPIQSASALEALADSAANPSTVAVASGGTSDEGISMPSPATTGAIAAGAALALSAAFVVRRRRPDDNVRPA